MKKPIKSKFLSLARDDDRITRLLKLIDKGIYVIDESALIKELEQLHDSRVFRNVTPDDLMNRTRKSVNGWVAENNAYRGRAVAIMMRCVRVNRKLQMHLQDARNYLSAEYSGYLRTEYTTDASKKKAVDAVLEKIIRKSHDVETVIELAKILIEDLDKSSWNTSYVNDIAKIEFQHERNS